MSDHIPSAAAIFLGIALNLMSEFHGTVERVPALAVTESRTSTAECMVCSEPTENFLGRTHPLCTYCLRQLDGTNRPACGSPIDNSEHLEWSFLASTSSHAISL